jgi:hypothetical protein
MNFAPNARRPFPPIPRAEAVAARLELARQRELRAITEVAWICATWIVLGTWMVSVMLRR